MLEWAGHRGGMLDGAGILKGKKEKWRRIYEMGKETFRRGRTVDLYTKYFYFWENWIWFN